MADSDQVAAIKARYRQSLSEKAETVLGWRAKIQAGVLLANERSELAEWLHRLAGSSGMYGYAEIATLTRQLMHRAEGGDVASSFIDEMKQLADLLKQQATTD